MIESLGEFKLILIQFLKNPLTYWVVLLSLLIAKKRNEIETYLFNKRVTKVFLEWSRMIPISLLASLIVSFIALFFGLVVSLEVILFLCIISLILTFLFHFKFLSAAYTIGFTYLLLMTSINNHYENSIVILAGLTLLIGIFLIFEAVLLKNLKNKHSSPEFSITKRGAIFGQLRMNRVSFIPFLIFVPGGTISPLFPIWPTLMIGDEAYSLFLIPFFIGFNYLFHGNLPTHAIRIITNQTIALGIIISILSIASFYYPILSLITVLLAISGKILIQFSAYLREEGDLKVFLDLNSKTSVFWIIPDSPAAKLGLEIGDIILKVNNHRVNTVEDFYLLINNNDSITEIQILKADNSVQLINGTLLARCEEELGLILV